MTDPTDADLIVRTRQGDHEAFALLVDRYKDRLVNYLTHLTGSRDRAEDFAQEAFVRLYQRASRYDEQGKLAPYLFRIATNLVRSENRRSRRWDFLVLKFPKPQEDHFAPQRALLSEEIQAKVKAAIDSLPPAYRSAVVLREIEEWSYEEIARALQCSEGTVKSRIFRGREHLRQALASYWKGVDNHERRAAH